MEAMLRQAAWSLRHLARSPLLPIPPLLSSSHPAQDSVSGGTAIQKESFRENAKEINATNWGQESGR